MERLKAKVEPLLTYVCNSGTSIQAGLGGRGFLWARFPCHLMWWDRNLMRKTTWTIPESAQVIALLLWVGEEGAEGSSLIARPWVEGLGFGFRVSGRTTGVPCS